MTPNGIAAGATKVLHGNRIHCWLEHKKEGGGDEHDADGILYLDPGKHPILASVPFLSSWPASPTFCLEAWHPGLEPHH